jgi:2-methylcitrate dehydratase PrpD
MNVTERLAAFAVGVEWAGVPPARAESLRLHAFDTIGALLAGAAVEETVDVRAVTWDTAALPVAVLMGCIAARCSEVDDIHLSSCVTPGAVVVPAALAVAAAHPEIDDATFLAGVLAGYEILVRLGVAVDGPRILYRGVWPTYLCSGFGVVATVGRMLGLDAAQLAEALAIVATRATGTSGRIPGRTSRWLTLGCAAHDAVLAVRAARQGLLGDRALLDGRWSEITGVNLDRDLLLEGLGERFRFDEISFKPICGAKQTIAAVYGLRNILAGGLAPDAIRDVLVEVPSAYHAMIDRPHLPSGRQDTFASVQYQLALAACAPDRLYDVTRATVAAGPDIRAFMAKVRVASDPALDRAYPQTWPASVTVTANDGSLHIVEIQRPFGDPGTGFDWEAAISKFDRTVAGAHSGTLAAHCLGLGTGTLPRVLAALNP